MQTTVTLNGQVYGFGRLPALSQFHVIRRVTPLFTKSLALLFNLSATGEPAARMRLLIENIGPVAELLAKMDDETANYVITECLKVCTWQQNGSWAPLTTATGVLLNADMPMPAMLRLTVAVIEQHIGDFFALLRDVTPTGAQQSTPTA